MANDDGVEVAWNGRGGEGKTKKFSVGAGIVNGEWCGRFLLGRYPGHEIRATSTGQALSSASLSCRYSSRGCRGI